MQSAPRRKWSRSEERKVKEMLSQGKNRNDEQTENLSESFPSQHTGTLVTTFDSKCRSNQNGNYLDVS